MIRWAVRVERGCDYVGFVETAGRHVGELDELRELNPGAHVCYVVRSPDHFDSWARRCLHEGAFAGQKPFRVISQAHALPDGFGREVTIIDPIALSRGGPGGLTVESVFALYRRETARAREEGFTGMRVISDMRWTLAFPWLKPKLAALELRMDEVVAEVGATVVCVYGQEDHAPHDLTEAVAVHPLTGGIPVADPGFRIWNVDRGAWEVAGEVDESNVDLFGRTLFAIAANGPVRVLRCGGLRFISAAGIGALSAVGQIHPGQITVIDGASRMLRRCWEILELDAAVPQIRFKEVVG